MKKDPNEASRSNIVKYLAGTMAVLYVFSGTALLLTYGKEDYRKIHDKLGPYSWGVGIALVIYGLFRGFSIYRQYYRHHE
jgi:hypothetical protein